MYVKAPEGTRKQRRIEPKLDNYWLDKDTGKVFAGDQENPVPTQYTYDGKHFRDRHGNIATFRLDKDDNIRNTSDAMAPDKDVNRITPECLNATGHEATYREILAKAMAEPLAHRCKYAIQMHFRTWCEYHNVEYPIQPAKLSEIYNLDIADFHKELLKIIRDGRINYPLHDAQKLLEIGKEGEDPPLAICCQATNVSLDALMDLLFQ